MLAATHGLRRDLIKESDMRGLTVAESRRVAGGKESEPPQRPGVSPLLWDALLERLERDRSGDRYRKRS